MNELTKKISGNYQAVQAIVIYKNDDDYYLENHRIEDGKMSEGKPMKRETISDMVEYFGKKQRSETVISGLIPENLLYCEWNVQRKRLLWWQPPIEKFMYFAKELHIKNGLAYQPGLLFLLKDDDLFVYVSGDKKPEKKSVIFMAPYHNVNNNGSVCLGSARIKAPKDKTYMAMIDYYDRLFWLSEFSHLADSDSIIDGNVNMFWNKMINQKLQFDYKVLLPCKPKFTYENLLNKIMR